ncbi:MAG: hypothetical protein PHQ46_11845 [Negativicutes bacterium]|nr:hypothetical protein [Negativicutes bacterium]
MNDKWLAEQIAKGLIATGVEGGYDAVTCSTAGDYPSMGCSQWEGLGGRGDLLLSYLDGGDHFAGRTYSDIEASGELDALAALLDSEQGHIAQQMILADDCRGKYIPALLDAGLIDDRCIIYAGIWCPTSHYVVNKFLVRRSGRGYDINSLDVLHQLFRDQYAAAADCEEYAAGYANRADATYDYVAGLEV